MAVNPILERGARYDGESLKHLRPEVKNEQPARASPWASAAPAAVSDSGRGATSDFDYGRGSTGGLNSAAGSAAWGMPPRRRSGNRKRGRDSPTPLWKWGSQGRSSKSPQGLSRSRGPPAKYGADAPVGSVAGSSAFRRATSRR